MTQWFPRTADGRRKMLSDPGPADGRTVKLACGCTTDRPPLTSNPERWSCCGALQRRKRRA